MMKLTSQIWLVSCCLFASTNLFAANISRKVTDGTTNKPSPGDEVVLLSLTDGMQETSRTQTDRRGVFSLAVPDQDVQYLIRIAHQRVNYFRPAQKGAIDVEITVYDSAKKIDNLTGEGRVFRVLAADWQQIQVSEKYILRNESQPPRTWMGDRTFEVVLPEGATLEEGIAAGPGGLPVTSAPAPTGVANHYAFIFPIRPGRSQLQVTYKLPYSGSHDFNFNVGIPLMHPVAAAVCTCFPLLLSSWHSRHLAESVFGSSGTGCSPAAKRSEVAIRSATRIVLAACFIAGLAPPEI